MHGLHGTLPPVKSAGPQVGRIRPVAKLATLTMEQKSAVKNEVETAVAEYFESGEMDFPAQALIVSGVVA